MNRRRVVWWSVAGVAIVALGVFLVVDGWIPGPKPSFPEGSGVFTYVDSDSLPPIYESGMAMDAGPITRDSAGVSVYLEDGPAEHGTLRVGETATFAGVTITLCDTWVNKWAYLSLSTDSGGTRANASRAYYMQSLDGSTPTCP